MTMPRRIGRRTIWNSTTLPEVCWRLPGLINSASNDWRWIERWRNMPTDSKAYLCSLKAEIPSEQAYCMLKITTKTEEVTTTFELEGRLAGAYVEELERCWRELPPGRNLKISLQAVTFVDDNGKRLLARL